MFEEITETWAVRCMDTAGYPVLHQDDCCCVFGPELVSGAEVVDVWNRGDEHPPYEGFL